jgi:hypothetical protein
MPRVSFFLGNFLDPLPLFQGREISSSESFSSSQVECTLEFASASASASCQKNDVLRIEEVDVVFACSTCFDSHLMEAISSQLVPLLAVGTRIITLSFPLAVRPSAESRHHLQLLTTANYLPSWGASVTAFVYERV